MTDEPQNVQRPAAGAISTPEVLAIVAEVHEEFIAPGHYRFASGGAVSHHDRIPFRWEMRQTGSGEVADAGVNLILSTEAAGDPLDCLSRSECRRWRRAERRLLRERDARQLTMLRNLAAAGGGLTGLRCRDGCGQATAAEFVIAGARIQVGRAHRPTLGVLNQALASALAVPLLTAGRYGPYWVLTFGQPDGPLAVLADNLTIIPDWPGGPPGARTPPASGRPHSAPIHAALQQ